MEETHRAAELKQVLGAIIFAAQHPLALKDIRKLLTEVAAGSDDATALAFSEIKETDLKVALDELCAEQQQFTIGMHLTEVAGGYRFQTDVACGLWVRHLLNLGKPVRLSRPGLETLAIIAYRQPVTRAEIESVRGVAVDHVLRLLMELQLVRIVGRSDLPGRPMLYGTTDLFLEHFGLTDIKQLPGIDELSRRAAAIQQAAGVRSESQAASDVVADAPSAEVEPAPDSVDLPVDSEPVNETSLADPVDSQENHDGPQ